jgi:anti-sigma-K factor RskA
VSAAEHDRFADDVGAYLLGALEDHERSAFERHAAVCHVCRDEVDRLRVAADALPRSVEQHAAPPSLKKALMKQVRADATTGRRRSWTERLRPGRVRPALALAATGLALLVGGAGGIALSGLGDDDREVRSLAASVDETRVGEGEATVVLPEGGGPGALRVQAMPQPPKGQVYEVWLRRGDRIEPGPLFSVDRNGRGVAAIPGDLDGVDEVMVTRERTSGARQPTEAPVISARL